MARIIDGHGNLQTTVYQIKPDNYTDLKERLKVVYRHLAALPSSTFCKLCSTVGKQLVTHGISGCPKIFNMCYKCLGKHPSAACSGTLFKVARSFCWRCWMPLHDIFGISFHSKQKSELGANCSNVACDYLKPLALLFFYNRGVAGAIECPCSDLFQYQRWLFEESASVSGTGQVPKILLLLEAVILQSL